MLVFVEAFSVVVFLIYLYCLSERDETFIWVRPADVLVPPIRSDVDVAEVIGNEVANGLFTFCEMNTTIH